MFYRVIKQNRVQSSIIIIINKTIKAKEYIALQLKCYSSTHTLIYIIHFLNDFFLLSNKIKR